ncbi:MAG: DUF799 family lipoprotein, partial [Elusimicrobia bacterium]|nr:DUF799 family lipoprotein [Elusimicrobiota bacterium]
WPKDRRVRVAVMPFKSAPDHPESGGLVYESFTANILEVKEYDVIERGALEEVLREQKLSFSGMIDENKAVEIGKLLGADAVLLGAVTEYRPRRLLMFPPARIALAARLVNTKTGLIEWTVTHRAGGMKRWLTWIIWPVGAAVTVLSPSVEDQTEAVARKVCRTLARKGASLAEK